MKTEGHAALLCQIPPLLRKERQEEVEKFVTNAGD
jgi:hypothetical protein